MIEPRKVQQACDVLTGAIEELQQEVEDKDLAYTQLQTEFNELQTQYDELKFRMDGLEK